MDWPKALGLLESEAGAAAAREEDEDGHQLLHVAARQKDVPLAVLRRLVELDSTALAANTKDQKGHWGEVLTPGMTPVDLARLHDAAPECLAYLGGEDWKLFMAEGAVEAEVIETLRTIGEPSPILAAFKTASMGGGAMAPAPRRPAQGPTLRRAGPTMALPPRLPVRELPEGLADERMPFAQRAQQSFDMRSTGQPFAQRVHQRASQWPAPTAALPRRVASSELALTPARREWPERREWRLRRAEEAVAAAARAQPEGELLHGFTVAGLSRPELNVAYEAAGKFGGLPLYRELGGGSAGIYWVEAGSVWAFHTEFTEEAARKGQCAGRLKPPHGKVVPLGECSAECWVDGDWQGQTVTLTALTAEGRAEAEADIEQLRAIRKVFDDLTTVRSTVEEDSDSDDSDDSDKIEERNALYAKALALLESEAGAAAARETDEHGYTLLHRAAMQKDVPLAVLRKLVEADPAALTAKIMGGNTPLDLARWSKAAPECLAFLSGENWKLFAAEGAVEAEVIEQLIAEPEWTYEVIVAALEAKDWPKALALLESEGIFAAARETDGRGLRLLHHAAGLHFGAGQEGVPLGVLRKLVEADPAALAAKTKDNETPLDLALESNAALECLGYLCGESWKLFAAEGAVEAEVYEQLRTIGESIRRLMEIMALIVDDDTDWPQVIALLESPGVAVAWEALADEDGTIWSKLLCIVAMKKDVPLVVVRKLVEADPAALAAKAKYVCCSSDEDDEDGDGGETPLDLARKSKAAPEILAILSGENWKLFAAEGAVEAEVIEQLRKIGEADFTFIKAALEAMDWPKALGLLESEAGAAAAREEDEDGHQLLHVAAEQKDVPLAVLRKLVELDSTALVAKDELGDTPLDLARESNAAPECLAYLSGENWKLFAAEGAVEAEVIETLRAIRKTFDDIVAALEAEDWPKAVTLLESEGGAAAARETDKDRKQLLHFAAQQKDVPLAVLRNLVEAELVALTAKTKDQKDEWGGIVTPGMTPLDLACESHAAPECLAYLSGENWKLFAAEGAVEAEVIEQLRTIGEPIAAAVKTKKAIATYEAGSLQEDHSMDPALRGRRRYALSQIKAALEAEDWAQVLALLDSEAGAAAARDEDDQMDAYGTKYRLLHYAAEQKDVPLAVLRKLVEADPAVLEPPTTFMAVYKRTPRDIARQSNAALECIAYLTGENWKLFAVEGALEAEVIDKLLSVPSYDNVQAALEAEDWPKALALLESDAGEAAARETDGVDKDGMWLLHHAALHESTPLPVLRKLVEAEPAALTAKTKNEYGREQDTPLDLAHKQKAAPECIAYLSDENWKLFAAEGAVEAEVIEKLRLIGEADPMRRFHNVQVALKAKDWPKALGLLDSEAGTAAAREADEDGYQLLHIAVEQEDVPLTVLRRLVEADPVALTAKAGEDWRDWDTPGLGDTPLDIARRNKAAPECVGYISGENWKLFAAEGVVEAEVVEQLRTIGESILATMKAFVDFRALVTDSDKRQPDWPEALALLESEAGAAAAREADADGRRLLHWAASRKDVPLAVLRKLVEADPAALTATIKTQALDSLDSVLPGVEKLRLTYSDGSGKTLTPVNLARMYRAAPECVAYMSGGNWKLFAAEGAVEAEVIEKLWAEALPEQMYDYIKAAIVREEWPKVLALLESEVGAAVVRETEDWNLDMYGDEVDEPYDHLLHIAANQQGVPLAVLRKLVDADPDAMATENHLESALLMARASNAAPECLAYLSGENWKLFAAEGAVEAEVIEQLRTIRLVFEDIKAALKAKDWPTALVLLESEAGAAAITDQSDAEYSSCPKEEGQTLLHIVVEQIQSAEFPRIGEIATQPTFTSENRRIALAVLRKVGVLGSSMNPPLARRVCRRGCAQGEGQLPLDIAVAPENQRGSGNSGSGREPVRHMEEIIAILVEAAGGIDVELDADKRTSRGILLGAKQQRFRDIAKSWGTFLGRYMLTDAGKHSSDTCLLAFADDFEKHNMRVALKLMQNREEWLREQEMRKLPDGTSLDGKHVVQLLEATELEEAAGTTDSRLQGHGDYRFMLTMPQAERDLSDALSHDRLAGYDQAQVVKVLYQVAGHLRFLNEECGRIHGDIKPRNLVQMLIERVMVWLLIDLDASCGIGSLAGQKVTSSAYFAPEMARQHLSSSAAGEAAAPVKASVALEMWSFGAVVYQLCTKDGATLWHSDQADNIDDDQLQQLAHEWDEVKAAKLKRIVWPQAAHLVSWLLQEDPAHRPQSWDQVMQHPFLAPEAGPAMRKRVVMSSPEWGTLDADGGSQRMAAGADAKDVFNQHVMDKVSELQQLEFVKLGFDRAGTSTAVESAEEKQKWADAFAPGVTLEEQKAIFKVTDWFYGYQTSVKQAVKLEAQGFSGVLDIICIKGGPITQLEAEEMDRIMREAASDCAKSGIAVTAEGDGAKKGGGCEYVITKLSYHDFLREVSYSDYMKEVSDEQLPELEPEQEDEPELVHGDVAEAADEGDEARHGDVVGSEGDVHAQLAQAKAALAQAQEELAAQAKELAALRAPSEGVPPA
eukprot:COSAG04_NODE_208_length_20334_cov_13.999852_1_plen_2534_part_10